MSSEIYVLKEYNITDTDLLEISKINSVKAYIYKILDEYYTDLPDFINKEGLYIHASKRIIAEIINTCYVNFYDIYKENEIYVKDKTLPFKKQIEELIKLGDSEDILGDCEDILSDSEDIQFDEYTRIYDQIECIKDEFKQKRYILLVKILASVYNGNRAISDAFPDDYFIDGAEGYEFSYNVPFNVFE